MFAYNGILFNHESPRRGETFVTRKISQAVARIKAGLREKLYLGNLEARRDWGCAREYVDAMWLMLQQEVPADFVIATGETHSVSHFLKQAFSYWIWIGMTMWRSTPGITVPRRSKYSWATPAKPEMLAQFAVSIDSIFHKYRRIVLKMGCVCDESVENGSQHLQQFSMRSIVSMVHHHAITRSTQNRVKTKYR